MVKVGVEREIPLVSLKQLMTLWQTSPSIKHHVLFPTDSLECKQRFFFHVVGAGDQRVSMAPDVAEQLIKDGYGVPRHSKVDHVRAFH